MKIVLMSDTRLRVESAPPPLTIEASGAEQAYSPFHMLASGLAMCSYSVLHSWAEHASLHARDLAVEVAWSFADKPHRVSDLTLTIDWLSLPRERAEAAQRTARLCAVHATLTHPPDIAINVKSTQPAAL